MEPDITHLINTLTESDWTELTSLLDRSKDTSVVGVKIQIDSGGYPVEPKVAQDVRHFLYDKQLIIPFDWAHWDEGRALLNKAGDNTFKNISSIDAVKLLTALVRNDRFNEGVWAQAFTTGAVAGLLSRLLAYQRRDS